MALTKILLAFYIGKQKKLKISLDKEKDTKNTKTTKQSHAYKGYASTYYVEILSSFNPELQLIKILNPQLRVNY